MWRSAGVCAAIPPGADKGLPRDVGDRAAEAAGAVPGDDAGEPPARLDRAAGGGAAGGVARAAAPTPLARRT